MRHYGPADRIEGVGEVRTRFVHIWFIPLIPLGSTFVVSEDDDGVRGVGVGFSVRSILVAWTRTVAVLGGLAAFSAAGIAAIGAAVDGADVGEKVMKGGVNAVSTDRALQVLGEVGMLGGAALGVLFCILLYWGVGRLFRDPSPERKAEILGQLGIAPGVDDPVDII